MEIPSVLKVEHKELHRELAHAIKSGGRTGEAAQAVAKVMHSHFLKEEEYVLPPLGLLRALSTGTIEPGMVGALKLIDRLEAELPAMLAEHKKIVAALERLAEAANAEDKPEYARFAERLIAHALTEEEISYPAALLIGRYHKAVLPSQSPTPDH